MDPRIDKILKLPTRQKVMILVAVVLLVGAALFFSLLQPKMKELKDLQARLESLRSEVQEKRRVADNLPKFKSEYEKVQKELDSALTELPNQKEIPSLLTSITSAGKGAGLDFLRFAPKPEVSKDFYAEVPVDIVVFGSYHSVANFFTATGNLPRIVNMQNVTFSDIKSDRGRTLAKVTCLATTFRFLDKKEIKDDKKKK